MPDRIGNATQNTLQRIHRCMIFLSALNIGEVEFMFVLLYFPNTRPRKKIFDNVQEQRPIETINFVKK